MIYLYPLNMHFCFVLFFSGMNFYFIFFTLLNTIYFSLYIYSSLYFFHYQLVPLYPLTPSNHLTVVHVHESFFLFALFLCPLTYPPTPAVICSPSMSLSLLLVSSVCLLDFSYEWNHMVFAFLWLAYFASHNVVYVQPYYCKGLHFLLFYRWVEFHCVNVP